MNEHRQAPTSLLAPKSLADTLPPHVWFCVSALFHYLGPAFAVLLFSQVGVLGMAWLRIATAALVFAPLTRPWRVLAGADWRTRRLLLVFGACLAIMNCSFYLALARLPISTVATVEFVGTIGVALWGARSARNLAALAIAVVGTLMLVDMTWSNDPRGLFWAFLNGALFVGYIILGHRVAASGAGGGIAGLTAALLLSRAGFKVTVFERSGSFSEVGAGLQISPNAGRILDNLGLGAALDAVATRPTAIESSLVTIS